MIDLKIVLLILFIHWIADFVLQTDWQAKNKSKRMDALLIHAWAYSILWLLPAVFLLKKTDVAMNAVISAWLFVIITFICHAVTDYFTSRLNAKLWSEGKVHLFFVSVGFDQFLHFTQLFLTYKLL